MTPVLTTYDPVQMSYAKALLAEAGIEAVVLDGSSSCIEAMMWPAFRLMVLCDEDAAEAAALLADGLKDWQAAP